ncbi:MAG: PEP-CTERM sorting domain-containing protein [Candidatus Omnitrophota bacterium]
MKKLLIAIVMCALVLGISASAQAVSLMPGAGDSLSTGAAVPSGTLLFTLVEDFTGVDALTNIMFTGTLTQQVFKNDTGMLFTYQFDNDLVAGRDAIHRMSITNFSGFTTDVDVLVANWEMERNSSGGTIGFNHPAGLEVDPGETSPVFWVQTNAKNYTWGSTQLIDGGIATIKTYAPATPEPSSMVLLGMGILGLFGLGRKKA